MDTQQEIEKLKREVAELKKWREEKTRQQISYPLDLESIKILSENFMRFDRRVDLYAGDMNPQDSTYYIGKQGSLEFIIEANTLVPYFVDINTDTFTATERDFTNVQMVTFLSENTRPAPLDDTIFYVVNASGSSFQVSLSYLGAPIDITDVGQGAQYVNIIYSI